MHVHRGTSRLFGCLAILWMTLALGPRAAQAVPLRFRQPEHDLVLGKARPVVVINLPARLLRTYVDGRLVFQCPVAIGRYQYPGVTENTMTRLGSYEVESWCTSYRTKEHPVPWSEDLWQGAFGVHTAILGPDALYQHLHGTVGPVELGDWIIGRVVPRERRPNESERQYREVLEEAEYGLSHGCVRVSNQSIIQLRELCPVGSAVHKIYCTIERYTARSPGDVTERWFPNVYRYEDIDNGVFYPERGVLAGYHHPEDNEHLGPALPAPED
ncbi:MAG: L,D-transpeptidase [Candidatus Riflebacteria bacterium]|nr:L,D-transpeptidase [Candidatus Riflebacteria bacterium]